MHHISVTTTDDTGAVLIQASDALTGNHAEAIAQAAYRALTATIDLYAASPEAGHHHLIALDDEPIALISTAASSTGRTDLNSTVHQINALTTD